MSHCPSTSGRISFFLFFFLSAPPPLCPCSHPSYLRLASALTVMHQVEGMPLEHRLSPHLKLDSVCLASAPTAFVHPHRLPVTAASHPLPYHASGPHCLPLHCFQLGASARRSRAPPVTAAMPSPPFPACHCPVSGWGHTVRRPRAPPVTCCLLFPCVPLPCAQPPLLATALHQVGGMLRVAPEHRL